MKRSKLVCLSLSLLVSIGLLAGCGGEKKEAGKASETVLKIGHVEPEDRSTHKALLNFKKKVEERSKGSLKIEIYPNGALGGDVQLSEAVATGSLDMALPSTSVLTTYNDEFGVLDMPYLFKSSEAAFKALDGDVGKELNGKIASKGIDILGYSYNGPRSTTSKVKPIVTPEDLKGLKMRVMESPIFIDFYKTLGANPTPIAPGAKGNVATEDLVHMCHEMGVATGYDLEAVMNVGVEMAEEIDAVPTSSMLHACGYREK